MTTRVALAIAHFIFDAHKGRDMACFDIPGTFLHADSDENIIIGQAVKPLSRQARQAFKPVEPVKPLNSSSCQAHQAVEQLIHQAVKPVDRGSSSEASRQHF
jgi:hypothetical protein